MKVGIKRLNMLAHLIKGLDVEQAMLQLMFLPRDHTTEVIWALKEGCKIAREVQKVDPAKLHVGMRLIDFKVTFVCSLGDSEPRRIHQKDGH